MDVNVEHNLESMPASTNRNQFNLLKRLTGIDSDPDFFGKTIFNLGSGKGDLVDWSPLNQRSNVCSFDVIYDGKLKYVWGIGWVESNFDIREKLEEETVSLKDFLNALKDSGIKILSPEIYALLPEEEKEPFLVANDDMTIGYKYGTFENIPAVDDTADIVMSTWALTLRGFTSESLKEICRVLKPGGKAYLFPADPALLHFEDHNMFGLEFEYADMQPSSHEETDILHAISNGKKILILTKK